MSHPARLNRRSGYSLIEVLVVVFTIGFLISLLLPAIQSIRYVVQRVECVNNLRQIGVGIWTYTDACRVLPPGVVNATGPLSHRPEGYQMSWVAQILPAMDQRGLSFDLNFDHGAFAAENLTVRQYRLSWMVCPSNPDPIPPPIPQRPVDDNGQPIDLPEGARADYAGCHHHLPYMIDENDTGLLFLNSAINASQIPDGTSTTLLVSEHQRDLTEWGWLTGTRTTLRNANALLLPQMIGLSRQELASLNLDQLRQRNLKYDPSPGFSSSHVGGTSMLFADGSVRFQGGVSVIEGHRSDGFLYFGEEF